MQPFIFIFCCKKAVKKKASGIHPDAFLYISISNISTYFLPKPKIAKTTLNAIKEAIMIAILAIQENTEPN